MVTAIVSSAINASALFATTQGQTPHAAGEVTSTPLVKPAASPVSKPDLTGHTLAFEPDYIHFDFDGVEQWKTFAVIRIC